MFFEMEVQQSYHGQHLGHLKKHNMGKQKVK
jgi:hypothetical protein